MHLTFLFITIIDESLLYHVSYNQEYLQSRANSRGGVQCDTFTNVLIFKCCEIFLQQNTKGTCYNLFYSSNIVA